MKEDIHALMDIYWQWVRNNTEIRELKDRVEITTPFLDRHNDCLQIYVKPLETGELLLTDDGYTVEDLEMTGFKIEGPTRSTLFSSILNGFGVESEGRTLEIKTSKENFGICKHNLIQAILAIDDMFYLASPSVSNIFIADVTDWLDHSHVRYSSGFKLTGKSGLDHRFDFVIPKSERHPERLLRSINRPDKSSAERLAFSWIDTQEIRTVDAQAFAILNDQEVSVPTNVTDALSKYEVHPIKWSDREEVQAVLAT